MNDRRRWRRRLAPALLFLVVAAPAFAAESPVFVRRVFFDAPYTAGIADVDMDGRLELPGLFNTGTDLEARLPSSMGLTTIRGAFGSYQRHARDLRLADLDNDGRPDVVANTYWCAGETRDRALLFLQRAPGVFVRGTGFDALPPLTGWGETIVAADFDNDGYADLFLPAYTRRDGDPESAALCAGVGGNAAGRSFLLQNRGAVAPAVFDLVAGSPVDLTEANCGVDCANYGQGAEAYARPEGAQAMDVDEDGHVDLFVSGMLFRNAGNAQFSRVFPPRGTTPAFDEGSRFLDWNNDGYPDLAIVVPDTGLVRLFSWAGGARDAAGRIVAGGLLEVTSDAQVGAFRLHAIPGTYSLTTADVNNDGYEDVVVNGAMVDQRPRVFVNQGPPGYGFEVAYPLGTARLRAMRGGLAAGDLNRDGRVDLVFPGVAGDATTQVLYNVTGAPAPGLLAIDALGGPPGAPLRNQSGRVIRVTPASAPPGFSYTRTVEGGSGYMAQGSYAAHVASRYAGSHRIEVRFARGIVTCMATPPAAVVIHEDAGFPCSVSPLPAADPVPPGHDARVIVPLLDQLLE